MNDPAQGWVPHESDQIWWRLNPRGSCTQFNDERGYFLFYVDGQLSPEMVSAICKAYLSGMDRGRERLQGEFANLMGLRP